LISGATAGLSSSEMALDFRPSTAGLASSGTRIVDVTH